jgi:16S rRNA (adenine1518-N6/adenine1519-N6)-dimethyltransferase
MARLGQHFLKNRKAAEISVEALSLRPEDTVIEIGPGHGELTLPLLSGAAGKVIALERDPALASALRARNLPKLEVVEGHALTVLGELLERTSGPVKIAGNIPYYITGHLLRLLSESPRRPERTVLLIQKEVAERLASQPPKMNRLAASVQYWADPKILLRLGPQDFRPAPKVDSAVISLVRREPPAAAEPYFAALRTVFAQPRQTLAKNLRRTIRTEAIEARLRELGLEPTLRPQNLSIQDLVGISSLFDN